MPAPVGQVAGLRAIIEFTPKLGSNERLCAGVVTRLTTGEIAYTCAIDRDKAEHAFGDTGMGLWHAAQALCVSLAEHWRDDPEAGHWIPPFESAKLSALQAFDARSAVSGRLQMLQRSSTLHTLLQSYEIPLAAPQTVGIVKKVLTAMRRDGNLKYLEKRFNRPIHIGDAAGDLNVDFLGQHFSCYFLNVSVSANYSVQTVERALGKLYQLQAIRDFMRKPSKSLGLLEDERPTEFELVMVAANPNSAQRRVLSMVEALADKQEVRARPLANPHDVAQHLAAMERMAA